MANRTDPLAYSIHGTNPQFLISKIVRSRIYQHPYWKQHCFGLTAESIIDKAVELKYIGGTYGGSRKASPFLCLLLKLLQIQPSKEIILEFIKNEDFKYLRALGALYFRLTGEHKEVYTQLEPLLADYKRVRIRLADGKFEVSHIDEFIDDCINKENLLDIDLPVLPKRSALESIDLLSGPRISALDTDVVIEGETVEVKTRKTNDIKYSEEIRGSCRDKEVLKERRDKPRTRNRDVDNRISRSGRQKHRHDYPSPSSSSDSRTRRRRYSSSSVERTHRHRHRGHREYSHRHQNGGPQHRHRHHRSKDLSSTSPSPIHTTDRRRGRSPDRMIADNRGESDTRNGYNDSKKRREPHHSPSPHRRHSRQDVKYEHGDRTKKKKLIDKQEREVKPSNASKDTDKSMSTEEWNKVRAQLGLKPLKK